jgi:copper(I)-binding protein
MRGIAPHLRLNVRSRGKRKETDRSADPVYMWLLAQDFCDAGEAAIGYTWTAGPAPETQMTFSAKSRVMALAATAALLATPGPAPAHEVKANNLQIVHPWVRATPKGVPVAAGYAKIRNRGKQADRLLSATLVRATSTQVHRTEIVEGIARMRAVPDGVEIQPGAMVELKPGGLHLMFEGLTESLVEHSYVEGTLTFAKAGTIKVEFAVEAPAAGEDPGKDHEH